MQRLQRCLHYSIKLSLRSKLTNKELIRLCLLGDQVGQKLLYEKFVTPMARLCLRYLKDGDEVQDALMEGFMRVFENVRKFEYRDESSVEVWIRKVMINGCLMRLRKNRTLQISDYADGNLPDVQKDETDCSAAEILSLIQTLPEGYRTVFNLFVIDGFSHKEIGGLLGINESASRSQLTHARNKLKELLRAHGWK
jgi:RNA polymerase sigma factor (sigma-70 family)